MVLCEKTMLGKLTSSMQDAIDLAFVQQLWMLGFYRFQFNGNFFTCRHIRPQINVTERTAPNLSTKTVLFPHTELHFVSVPSVTVYGSQTEIGLMIFEGIITRRITNHLHCVSWFNTNKQQRHRHHHHDNEECKGWERGDNNATKLPVALCAPIKRKILGGPVR